MRGTHYTSLVDWNLHAVKKGLRVLLAAKNDKGEFYQAISSDGVVEGYFNLWLPNKERRISGGELPRD